MAVGIDWIQELSTGPTLPICKPRWALRLTLELPNPTPVLPLSLVLRLAQPSRSPSSDLPSEAIGARFAFSASDA
ncbi:hypothetical protein GMDG_00635 [Pseudogymnoascus destructans 20631-21]|uniref:Uncharacterized protein n=1 Tax=Pseudogymnoascus destructans (strain ATCC MYA-4855 / 20631-21) TaxID=658429 RepID=L8G7D1_PSED2|nr:hypothetical protein GMDG_00635 [Pseudogymnoascus destructans 20631-21]